MPHWLMLAMGVSFIYAIINHLDKAVLQRYAKEDGPEVLLVFSGIFAMFGIPYAVYMEPAVLNIGAGNASIMLGVAVLNTVLLYCYLKATAEDDPARVIFFYQLVPVFSAIIGYFVLGETITQVEMLAMALIIIGTSIAGVEYSVVKGFSIKWKTALYMTAATTCWALEMVIGKIVILDESVYHSIFWESAFMVLVAVVLLVAKPSYRHSFTTTFKINKWWVIGFMLAGEALYAAGNSISAHASAIKEVAMVMLTQPLQTIFVFGIGLLLTRVWPDIYGRIDRPRLIQMALAIPIAFAGTYLLL